MANIHDDPAALKALQDDIYRERILRARRMTVEERLAECFELSNRAFDQMHEDAMRKLSTRDPELGWAEVRRHLEWLERMENAGRFVQSKPAN